MSAAASANALYRHVRDRLSALPARDALAIKVLVIFLSAVAYYVVVWNPALSFKNDAAARHARSTALRTWMHENEAAARRLGTSPDAAEPTASLLAMIDASARNLDLRFQRYEPRENAGVRVWLEDVPFNDVIAWLDQLASSGIQAMQISVERKGSAGLVDVTLELD